MARRSRGRILGGIAVTAALLVPLAVFGAPALAKTAAAASGHEYGPSCGQYGSSGGQYGSAGGQYGSSGSQYGSSSCRQYRVTICHRTHSRKHPWVMITVNVHALNAHLRHGDTMPPCSAGPDTGTKKHHGHGHESGQAGA